MNRDGLHRASRYRARQRLFDLALSLVVLLAPLVKLVALLCEIDVLVQRLLVDAAELLETVHLSLSLSLCLAGF